MTRNTLIISALAFLAIAVVSFLYVTNTSNVRNVDTKIPPTIDLRKSLLGVVVSVSLEKSSLSVKTASGTSSEILTVLVGRDTRIQKMVQQKNGSGAIERQLIEELNVGDLAKGDEVTVIYSSDISEIKTPSLADTILLKKDSDVDDYIKNKIDNGQYLYLKSKATAVDMPRGIVSFSLYTFGSLSTTTQDVTLNERIPVYTVTEDSLVPIIHARAIGTIQDISLGTTFYLMTEKKGFDGKIKNPTGIIVIEK